MYDFHLMVKVNKPSVLILMETKIHNTRLTQLKYLLDFHCHFTVDGIGCGGNLALLSKKGFPLEIHSFSQRHINTWINYEDSYQIWMLTCFYGHPESDEIYWL